MKNSCLFCDDNTKIERAGRYFCPNGHYIVTIIDEPLVEIIQPRSTGSIEGKSVYRLNSIRGKFCNDVGKPLSDIKDESLNSEVN